MSAGHQQFSARTRKEGELEPPEGGRRRNLETGRLSVVLGADAACVLVKLAAEDSRSVGSLIRKIVLEWLAGQGYTPTRLAARAAELRAEKAAELAAAAKAVSGKPAVV